VRGSGLALKAELKEEDDRFGLGKSSIVVGLLILRGVIC
jgi:hypothetical protein